MRAVSSTVQGGRSGAKLASGPLSARPPLTAPIFFRLTLHCRRRRVLDLEPVVDASRPIVRTEPLRHDAFAAERTGVLEDDPAVDLEMLVEGDADAAQKFGEHCLAVFERLPPEVRAVRFDQVESAQDGRVVAKPVAEDVEDRETVLVDHDGLAVDHA